MQAAADYLTIVSNGLPTGPFLAFQALAPLATNNGDCGVTDKVLTSIALVILYAICVVSCFTDSYTAENSELYYGFVTPSGLWNPKFQGTNLTDVNGWTYTGGDRTYTLNIMDFVNAGVSVAVLATVTLLTAPVTNCFYPQIPGSISKVVPLVVAMVGAFICKFTNLRRGIGFGLPAVRPAQPPQPAESEARPLLPEP